MTKTNTPARQATQPPAQRRDFPDLLMKSQAEFAKVIRSPEMVDRFMRVALTEFKSRPELAQCDPLTTIASVMLAAQLNLEVGGGLKQCYLIPYKNICKLEVSYIGFLELARRSGEFRHIDACLVNANDEFKYERDSDHGGFHRLYHKPDLWNPGEPGTEKGVYVFARLANGEPQFLAMNRAEIEQIRACSKFPQGAPWTMWWGEMAKKTVLRRFLKTQRQTPELVLATENDNDSYILDEPGRVGARVQPRRGLAGLREQLQLDEPTLAPQPSRVYSEADESSQDPGDTPEGPSGDVADYGGEGATDDAREG